MKYKFTERRSHFFLTFTVIVLILAIVKCVNPNIGENRTSCSNKLKNNTITEANKADKTDSIAMQSEKVDKMLLRARQSVRRFEESFPDLNDVQLATAERVGISHIENRSEAQKRMDDLVYIGDNPFYNVQKLNQSIPYLVPRAAVLLNEIARAFNDSLATKGFPPHKLIVTSVLRTREDVKRLRRFNSNASENSCHQHGTTFDISYNRFLRMKEGGESDIQWVTAFKSILAEVLEDQRLMGTCYVKYERHQSCFHITAR